jgi:hypothetical protein
MAAIAERTGDPCIGWLFPKLPDGERRYAGIVRHLTIWQPGALLAATCRALRPVGQRASVWVTRARDIYPQAAGEVGQQVVPNPTVSRLWSVAILLNRYLPIERQLFSWYTPLGDAISGNDRDRVSRLLQLGANPNQPGCADIFISPLAWAVWQKDTQLVHLLITAGATVNASMKGSVKQLLKGS